MRNFVRIADVVFKGVAAFAGLFIVFVASSFQSSMTAATLQSQREQADSLLRASMFSDLIDSIVGPRNLGGAKFSGLDDDRQ